MFTTTSRGFSTLTELLLCSKREKPAASINLYSARYKANFLRSVAILTLFSFYGWNAYAQTITWANTGASTAWYTAGNWSPSTGSGAWTTSNNAQFANTGTATTAGINMGTASLSVGAIEVTSARTRALTIGSSSSNGTLTLNGITVNSVSNVIIRNNSNSLLTLQNNETGTGKTMNVVLANSTNNIINIDGTGGVTISSVISGTSKNLTKAGAGSGVLTLSGANTYTGTTTISTGTLQLGVANAIPVGNPGGGVILNGGTLNNGGFADGSSATSNMGTLTLSDNSTLALSGSVSLYFAASNAATWTSGKVLTITGWSGTPAGCTTGTGTKVFIGSNASSLTASQLAQIKFVVGGVNYPATLLSTGELVPTLKLEVPNPGNQIALTGFSITVSSKDFDGTARNVSANTNLTLTSATNTIGGTTTGTINSGSSSVTISGVTLTSGTAATITASAGSGFCLLSHTSGTFDVSVASGHVVTFNANGGSGTMSAQNSSTATALNTNTFTRAGYTFNGWATSSGGAVAYADGDVYTFATDITLYAKWTANTYNITFNGNGATGGSMGTQSLATDASANLNSNGYTRTGYTFAGWATTAGGAVAYANAASYTMGPGNTTLYAKWTANNNTITFDANGGTGSMSNQTIATDATANLNANTYTRVGYVFSGWSTTAGGAVAYVDQASYTMGTTNVTLYAQWTVGPCFSMNAPDFPNTSGSTTNPGDVDAGGSPTNTIRLASASNPGSISTNAIAAVSGDVTVKFRAKAWSGTETAVSVTLGGSTQNVTNVPTSFGEITLTFTSVAAGSVLQFSSVAGKRVHIGNVNIYCAPACTQPTTQATFTSINNNGASSLDVNFTRGDGDGIMIVAKSGTAASDPSSGTLYNLSDAVGTGTVVYKGSAAGTNTASSQSIGSLNAETQYYFNFYEYVAASNCYKTPKVSGNAWTLSTEPTAHSSTFTCSAVAYNQINLSFSAASGLGADGYIVLQKINSTPTSLPTDAVSYSVGNTIGDATVAAIINSNSATSQSITSLTDNTTYYYTLVPYNWNGSNSQTYNYRTSATVPSSNCTTPLAPSVISDIVDAGDGAMYTSNINYRQWQSTTISNTGSNNNGSVGVFKFIIRDGGSGTSDTDLLPTILTSINFTYTGTANSIRSAALFNANAFISQGTVSANGISFSGLSGADVTANDNGTKTITLRVTFNSTVTDNQKLVFSIASATAGTSSASSQFTTISAQSDNNGANDRNRIEVSAGKLSFVQEPTSASINVSMAPSVTVAAIDSLGNRDLDFTSAINITSTGSLSGSPVSSSASAGLATYAGLTHTVAGTGLRLYAASSGLISDTSGLFNITEIVFVSGDYRTASGGNWHSTSGSNTASWEQYNGTVWNSVSTAPATSAASLGTKTVYIRDSIFLVGTNTASNVVIMEGGILNTSTVSATFGNLTVKSGGKFYRQANGSGVSGTFEVEDSGTVYFIHTSTGSRSTSIWAGTEKFHANSNFVIRTTDNANNFLVIQANSDVSEFNGACFGNIIIDQTAGNSIQLLPPGFNKTLANGDLIFRRAEGDIRFLNSDYTTTIKGDLVIESTFTLRNVNLYSGSSGIANLYVNGSILHRGSLNLNLSTTAGGETNLYVGANIVANAPITYSTTSPTKIIFNGSGTQNVSGSGTLNIYNAEINKSAGLVNLERNILVKNNLQMTTGNIQTNSFTLELGENTSNKGTLTYTAGYVLGNMKRWFSGTNSTIATSLFPLGYNDGGIKNRSAKVEFTSAPVGGALTAYFIGSPMGMTTIPIAVGSANSASDITFDITSTENQGYWVIENTSGDLTSGTYTMTLTGQGFSTITDPTKLVLLKRPNASTPWFVPGSAGTGTLASGVYSVTRSGMSSFSHFGFGGGSVNPLPVELISFTGECNGNDVKLDWSTASEQNSERFVVEKSSDLQLFEYIASVAAAGNSNEVVEYAVSVPRTVGITYFRLRQEDFDGAFEYFGPIAVNCENGDSWNVYAFGSTLYISADEEIPTATLSIYDMNGRELHKENIAQVSKSINQTIDLSNLLSGMYVVNVSTIHSAKTFKVILTK